MKNRSTSLVFLSSFRYPSTHAHPIWSLQMARGFAALLGNSFLFVIADTKDRTLMNGIPYVRVLPGLSRLFQKLRVRSIAYALWVPLFLALRSRQPAIFTNDPRLARIAIFYKRLFGWRVAFESHGDYTPTLRNTIYGGADRIVFISDGLQNHALGENPALKEKSTVEINAVDVASFSPDSEPMNELRASLDVPIDPVIIGYIGRFRPGGFDKGVPFMIRSLASLPSQYHMLLVGGTSEEISEMQSLAQSCGVSARITFRSFVPPQEVPRYTRACDIVAYVPEASSFRHRETIPMKILEYMAAKRPIVTVDMPAIRELLDDSCAFFCVSGSEASFAAAVDAASRSSREATERAFERVKEHTWEKRSARIAEFVVQ